MKPLDILIRRLEVCQRYVGKWGVCAGLASAAAGCGWATGQTNGWRLLSETLAAQYWQQLPTWHPVDVLPLLALAGLCMLATFLLAVCAGSVERYEASRLIFEIELLGEADLHDARDRVQSFNSGGGYKLTRVEYLVIWTEVLKRQRARGLAISNPGR